jgi:hypothetical protein
MLGRRSLNLELLPLDLDIDRVFRKKCKTPVEWRTTSEMEDNMAGNPNVNVEQPEQPRAENVDYTRPLRDLSAPVATNFGSCIDSPPISI